MDPQSNSGMISLKDNVNILKHIQLVTKSEDKKSKLKNRQFNVTLSDLQQLIKNIKFQQQKNALKLTQIRSLNRCFAHTNLVPTIQINFSKIGMITSQQLLLKQLDKLLEEGHILQKQFNKCKLNIQLQDNNKVSLQIEQSKNHYSFLRRVWSKSKTCQVKSEQKIQMLNMQVAIIKKNILQMTDAEKNITDINKENSDRLTTKNYKKIEQKISQIIQQSQIYQALKQKYEASKMTNQQNQSIISSLICQRQQNLKVIKQKNKQNSDISEENKRMQTENNLSLKLLSEKQKQIQLLKSQLANVNSTYKNFNCSYCIQKQLKPESNQIFYRISNQQSQNNHFQNKQCLYKINQFQNIQNFNICLQSFQKTQQLKIFLKDQPVLIKNILNKYQNPEIGTIPCKNKRNSQKWDQKGDDNLHENINKKADQIRDQNIARQINNKIGSPIRFSNLQRKLKNTKFIRMNATSPKKVYSVIYQEDHNNYETQ